MQIKDRIKEFKRIKASDLIHDPKNWRIHPQEQKDALKSVLEKVGFADAVLVRETPKGLMLVDGHLRAEMTEDTVIPVLVLDVTEEEAEIILATHDPITQMALTDESKYADLLASAARHMEEDEERCTQVLHDLATQADIEVPEFELPIGPNPSPIAEVDHSKTPSLAERFAVPPFSTLDARQGYWQNRKRAWLSLGIDSELGRGDKASPSGSPRPAMNYKNRERGDGSGKPIKNSGAVKLQSPSPPAP